MNQLVAPLGIAYDLDGEIARSGIIIPGLYDKLNDLHYYHQVFPKSLSREWLEREFLPLILIDHYQRNDLLRTIVEHIAFQINQSIKVTGNHKILVTGGGAHNKYLIERIRNYSTINCVIPSDELVDYKEGLIFALLGVLRWKGEINVINSVTGGKSDHCGGAVYNPFKSQFNFD